MIIFVSNELIQNLLDILSVSLSVFLSGSRDNYKFYIDIGNVFFHDLFETVQSQFLSFDQSQSLLID